MSPRRTRPRGRKREPEPERRLAPEMVTGAPPGWQARAITADRAEKRYRCPGCEQEIMPGTAHIVAWRSDHEHDRRHWHRPCWDRQRRTLR